MRYRPVNLIGGFNVDSAYPWAVEDTINYIPEKASSPGTRTPSKLRGAPGLKPYVQIAETGSPIRGSHNAEGRRFVVSGTTAYQITNAGVAIPLGTVPGVQRVNLAHNQIPGGNEIIITTGTPNSYVYNTVTQVFEKITDAGYPGAGSVDYIDTFLVQVEPFGRYWFWSAQADAMNYNTLDRAEAEASPDPIVGLAVNNFEVIIFGQSTVEFFYNAGTVTGTFQSKRIWIQHGCAAAATIQKMDNTIYWLSPERILYRLNGYAAQPVSTPQFEEAIAGYDLSTAFAFVYEDQGHKIYYLTFPGGKTFGFDVTTGLMHRRESYGLDRWRLNTLEKWGDAWVGGDFQSGKLYTVDWGYMLEGVDTPLVAERVSGVISSNQNNVTIPYVEVLVDSGQPETVAGETQFPVQPTGPTITGAAPDGVVAMPYAGYTYTLTGTAPLTVTLRSGSLPAGLSISTAGVIDTGTPTVLGSETFTLRVTDANGLWAELPDTIDITGIWWLVAGQAAVDTGLLHTSGNAITWSSQILVSPTIAEANYGPISLGAGFAVIAGISFAQTGGDIELVTDFDTSGGVAPTIISGFGNISHIRYIDDVAFIISVLTRTYYYSTDHGANWTSGTIPATAASVGLGDIARLDSGRWVGIGQGNPAKFVYSDEDVPINWTLGADTDAGAGGNAGGYLLSSGTALVSFQPAGTFVRSTDGVTWTSLAGPGYSDADRRDGLYVDGVFIAQLGQRGSIIRSTDNGLTWTEVFLTGVQTGAAVQRFEYGNGKVIAMMSGGGATYYYSTDLGLTWTAATAPLGGPRMAYLIPAASA